MNKQEWKKQYGAARLMANVRRSAYKENCSMKAFDTPSSKKAWSICYEHIRNNMPEVYGAVFYPHSSVYDIKKCKWACKHNSKAFNRHQPKRTSKMKWRAA